MAAATNDTSGRIAPAARQLSDVLGRSPRSIAVADALTGGLLVQALAGLSEAGRLAGVVAPGTALTADLLGVTAHDEGASRTAGELASAARSRFGSDIGIAVCGPSQPRGAAPAGSDEVWLAVDVGDGPVTRLLPGDRDPAELRGVAVAEVLRLTAREVAAPPPAPRATEPVSPTDEADVADDGFWRRNGLSLACFALFAVFLLAQSLTGWRSAVADALEHGEAALSYWRYLTTGHFAEATFENWESEFLQMGAFVLLTVFLVQRGSGESKQEADDPRDADPRAHRDDPGAPWPVRRGGAWLVLYENSLLLAFVVLFVGSLAGHAVSGAHEFSSEQHDHGSAGVSPWQFARTAEFWFQSFQNWQSEFLAVGAIVVLSVFLRQRGSAESKPVHAPHRRTGDD